MSSISLFRLCPVGLLFTTCSYVQTIYVQLRGMAQGAPCSPELLPPILHDASGLESHSTLAFWTVFRQESHSEELPLQGLCFLLGMLIYPEKKNSCRPTSNFVKPMPSAVGVASLSSREELDFLVLRYPLENHILCWPGSFSQPPLKGQKQQDLALGTRVVHCPVTGLELWLHEEPFGAWGPSEHLRSLLTLALACGHFLLPKVF